tara:strand:- start:5034 stop:6812 length:1779 start_codon:yes stop_codon:yes gene_type:complete
MAKKSVAEVMGKQAGIQAPAYKIAAAQKVNTFVKTSPQLMPVNKNEQIADAINQAVGLGVKVSAKRNEEKKAAQFAAVDETFAQIAEEKKNSKDPSSWMMSDSELYKNSPKSLQVDFARKMGKQNADTVNTSIAQQLADDPSIQLDPMRLKGVYDQHRVAIDSEDGVSITRDATFNNALDKSYQQAQNSAISYNAKITDEATVELMQEQIGSLINGTLQDEDGAPIKGFDAFMNSNTLYARFMNKGLNGSVAKEAFTDAYILHATTLDESLDGTDFDAQVNAKRLILDSFPNKLNSGVAGLKVNAAYNDLNTAAQSVKTKKARLFQERLLSEKEMVTGLNGRLLDDEEYNKLTLEGKGYYNLAQSQDANLDIQASKTALTKHQQDFTDAYMQGSGIANVSAERQKNHIYNLKDISNAQKEQLIAELRTLEGVGQFLRDSDVVDARNGVKDVIKSFLTGTEKTSPYSGFDPDTYGVNVERNFNKRIKSRITEKYKENGNNITESEVDKIADEVFTRTLKKIKQDRATFTAELQSKDNKTAITAALPKRESSAINEADAILETDEEKAERLRLAQEDIVEGVQNFTNQFTPFDQ